MISKTRNITLIITISAMLAIGARTSFADEKARGYGIVPVPTPSGINVVDIWGFRVNLRIFDVAVDTGHITFNAKARFVGDGEAIVGYYTNPLIAHGIPTGRANMAPFCWINVGSPENSSLVLAPQAVWDTPIKILPNEEKRLGLYATRASSCASRNSVNCDHYAWVCYFGGGGAADANKTSALWKVNKKLILESAKAGVYVSDRHTVEGISNPANRAAAQFNNFWFWLWQGNCPTGCPPTPTPPSSPMAEKRDSSDSYGDVSDGVNRKKPATYSELFADNHRITTCTVCDFIDFIGIHFTSSSDKQKTSDEENGGAIVKPDGSSAKWVVCYGDVSCHDPNQATPTAIPTAVCNGPNDIGTTMTYNGKEYRCTQVPGACWHGLGNLEPQWGEGKLPGSRVIWPGGACNWPKQAAPFYSIAASANNKSEGGPGFYERCTGTFEFMSKSPSIPFKEFRHNRDVSEVEGLEGTPSVPDIVERYVPCSGCDGINGAGQGQCWGSTAYTWVYWMPYDKPHPTLGLFHNSAHPLVSADAREAEGLGRAGRSSWSRR